MNKHQQKVLPKRECSIALSGCCIARDRLAATLAFPKRDSAYSPHTTPTPFYLAGPNGWGFKIRTFHLNNRAFKNESHPIDLHSVSISFRVRIYLRPAPPQSDASNRRGFKRPSRLISFQPDGCERWRSAEHHTYNTPTGDRASRV